MQASAANKNGDTKQKARLQEAGFLTFLLLNSGSPTWTRTRDLRINSPSLYRLSYQGIDVAIIVSCEQLAQSNLPTVQTTPRLAFWLPDLDSNQGPAD